MSRLQGRFLGLLLLVSGLAAASAGLMISGGREADPLRLGAGGFLGLIATVGVVVLARMVVLTERQRGPG